MKKQRLSAQEAKELWIETVDELIGKNWGSVSFESIKEKMKKVTFGYGGVMKKYRTKKDEKVGKVCRWYHYVNYKFPAVVYQWELRKCEKEAIMNLLTGETNV